MTSVNVAFLPSDDIEITATMQVTVDYLEIHTRGLNDGLQLSGLSEPALRALAAAAVELADRQKARARLIAELAAQGVTTQAERAS